MAGLVGHIGGGRLVRFLKESGWYPIKPTVRVSLEYKSIYLIVDMRYSQLITVIISQLIHNDNL